MKKSNSFEGFIIEEIKILYRFYLKKYCDCKCCVDDEEICRKLLGVEKCNK
ncbi:MAG: hypothetical protein WC523_05020 [Patescibacteria group bacterium]